MEWLRKAAVGYNLIALVENTVEDIMINILKDKRVYIEDINELLKDDINLEKDLMSEFKEAVIQKLRENGINVQSI